MAPLTRYLSVLLLATPILAEIVPQLDPIPDKVASWHKQRAKRELEGIEGAKWTRKRLVEDGVVKNIFEPVEGEAIPGETFIADKHYSGHEEVQVAPILDSRALLDSWLNPRGLSKRACVNAGSEECADGSGCCPGSAQNCCPGSPYCKKAPADECCGALGTCPSPYKCHSFCECIEEGAMCCPNGNYCTAGNKCCAAGGCAPEGGDCCTNGRICDTGNICVVNTRTGEYGCCTDVTCTAYVDNGVTITATTDFTTVRRPNTTPAPIPSSIGGVGGGNNILVQTWSTTVYWTYYYYFWTYVVIQSESTLASEERTTFTEVTVTGTDEDVASTELASLADKASAEFETPVEATTATAIGTAPIPFTTTKTRTASTPPANTGLRSGDGPTGAGDGGGAAAGLSAPWAVWVWGAGAVAVGAGMVVL